MLGSQLGFSCAHAHIFDNIVCRDEEPIDDKRHHDVRAMIQYSKITISFVSTWIGLQIVF